MQVRKHLEKIPPYSPIEPFEVLSARLGRSVEQIIKLDANENPYGALAVVREALAGLSFTHVYPDPESRFLREKLAEFCGVNMENILVGAGADELIDLILRVFIDAGDSVLICPPTFGMYAFDARLNNAKVIEVWRKKDFSLDYEEIKQVVLQSKPKMLFLATPNNPDGSFPLEEELNQILELPLLVILDEAYIEFADHPQALGNNLSRIREVPQRENLIVLRTFSKLAGLAGLRVGYGAFPDWLMPTLWKVKQPYNVNVAASTAALACLDAQHELSEMVERICTERQGLYLELQKIPYLSVYPSRANFLLAKVLGKDASALKNRLAQEFGILVRYFKSRGLEDHIRISVGKPADTNALIRALQILAEEKEHA
ncbi:MAG: histidinol-phosphate transaminase [Anaerolineales bacterium]